MKRALLTLALVASMAAPAAARVAFVVEQSSSYGTTGATPAEVHKPLVAAIRRIMAAYGRKDGVDFDIVPRNSATTGFCRTGQFFSRRSGTNGWDATSPSVTYSAVVHVGYNDGGGSALTGYRPDSIAFRTSKYPSVPQLYLYDAWGISGDGFTLTTDSVGVAAFQLPGEGSGNHEGESTVWVAGRAERSFDPVYSCTFVMGAQPNGGSRQLLQVGANATMTNGELTGNMPSDPDSLNPAATDTVLVFEKLNQHVAGAARMTFANVAGASITDSTGAGIPSRYASVNVPVLLFALAHLDSLTGGDVFGDSLDTRVPKGYGFVVTGGGGYSDRRHPGGIFEPDTTILKASVDSLASRGIKFVVAADPESLAAKPSHAAMWMRNGLARFTPTTRLGLDTLALGANGRASFAAPVDVFGRYRNRAIYGDSSYHAVMGSDSSVFQLYKASRSALADIVGSSRLSRLIVAPDFDWTPYQVRKSQNADLVDSLAWMAAQLGQPAILVNTHGLDNNPNYLTNPKGWPVREGWYEVKAASRRGERVRFIGFNNYSVRGSQNGSRTDGLSFLNATSDTLPPFVAPPNQAVRWESWFWSGLFGAAPRDYQFDPYDLHSDPYQVYDLKSLYEHDRSSVLVLPAQSLGGQVAAAPNRWGYFAMKHIKGFADMINYKAGRTLLENRYPEDIEP